MENKEHEQIFHVSADFLSGSTNDPSMDWFLIEE